MIRKMLIETIDVNFFLPFFGTFFVKSRRAWVDFPVIHLDISDEQGSPDFRAAWYQQKEQPETSGIADNGSTG